LASAPGLSGIMTIHSISTGVDEEDILIGKAVRKAVLYADVVVDARNSGLVARTKTVMLFNELTNFQIWSSQELNPRTQLKLAGIL
jgi:hypothetical protein